MLEAAAAAASCVASGISAVLLGAAVLVGCASSALEQFIVKTCLRSNLQKPGVFGAFFWSLRGKKSRQTNPMVVYKQLHGHGVLGHFLRCQKDP